MNRRLTFILAAFTVFLAYTPLVQAQDATEPTIPSEAITNETLPTTQNEAVAAPTEPTVPPEAAPEAAAKTMTPEEQEMMAKMEAYSTPNENHQLLTGLAGKWDVKVTHWMKPEGEGESSIGALTSTSIMGGRFLEQNFSGSMMGQPFEGRGIYGYDNILKKFRTIWFDNVGTGIMSGNGTYDAATKKLTEEGNMSCPMTNGERWYRSETTLTDSDHYSYETFMKDESGTEFRSMLIEYIRIP